MNTTRPNGCILVTVLSVALLQVVLLANEVNADAFLPRSSSAAFLPNTVPRTRLQRQTQLFQLLSLRGGDDDDDASSAIDIDIDVDDIESSDEEEDEELDPKLAKAAQAASVKVKTATKKAAVQATKAAVASSLSSTKKKKTKSGLMKFFRIPYIVKACLNPFTFWQMTAGYWKSLIDLNYLEEMKEPTEDLRSGLEAKARKGGGSSSSRKKRKMKPGQAKTLSDLPQLNTWG